MPIDEFNKISVYKTTSKCLFSCEFIDANFFWCLDDKILLSANDHQTAKRNRSMSSLIQYAKLLFVSISGYGGYGVSKVVTPAVASVAAPVYGGYGGYGAGYGVSKVVSPVSTVVSHGYGYGAAPAYGSYIRRSY